MRRPRSVHWALCAVAVALLLSACRHSAPASKEARDFQGQHPTHVVEKGETAFGIARQHGVALEELLALNRLGEEARIYAGQRLLLPAAPAADAREKRPTEAEPEAPVREPRDGASADRGGEVPVESLTCDPSQRAPAGASAKGMRWPVEGVVISGFGRREGERHDGIDIAAPRGTPVWASLDGKVVYVGEQEGYGQLVILHHDDNRVTIYAKNAKNCVADGARVVRGDVIALVGESGGSNSPYVHFEVREGTKPLNPRAFLPR